MITLAINWSAIWEVVLPVLGCLLGFLIREAMAISARRNSETPSWIYYWSLAKNRWTVFINGLCTVAAMLGRSELVSITGSAQFAIEWPKVYVFTKFLVVAPFWTSLGIGLFAAFAIRWLITMIDQRFGRSKKLREAQADQASGQ